MYVYSRLVNTFPDTPWKKSINTLKKNQKSTVKQFTDYLISYGIELWESKGEQEYDSYLTATIADSMFYCGKILELFDLAEEKYHARLKSRFSAAK